MDAVGLLVHDHEVLTAHIEHVSALIYGLAGRAFEPELVYFEFRRQVNIMRDEVAAHFLFEEESAFPKLVSARPEFALALGGLAKAHERILQELAQLCDLEAMAPTDFARTIPPLAQAFEHFATSYRNHLREEDHILAALEAQLGEVELDGFEEMADGLSR